MARIVVENLSKEFKLPHERHTSLKSTVLNFYKKKTYERFSAIDDVSFQINDGEFFGIVGRNGSGKSTLLKLLADIYTPSGGKVTINGRLTPFIELGVGFNPELTGRENVYLNGAILGLTQTQIDSKYEEIVDFSELSRFMDQKLKNYSSGMQVRLAFSIAIQAHNDILLIDEVLAVGDANFQRKCFNVFKKIKKSGKTVILVTHDMGAIQEYCDRALLLDAGKIVKVGDITKVSAEYNKLNFDTTPNSEAKTKNNKKIGTQDVFVKNVIMLSNEKKAKYFTPNDDIQLKIDLECANVVDDYLLGYTITNSEERVVFSSNTLDHNIEKAKLSPGDRVRISASFKNQFDNGTYFLSVAVKSGDRQVIYDQITNTKTFEVAGWDIAKAVIHMDNSMEAQKL